MNQQYNALIRISYFSAVSPKATDLFIADFHFSISRMDLTFFAFFSLNTKLTVLLLIVFWNRGLDILVSDFSSGTLHFFSIWHLFTLLCRYRAMPNSHVLQRFNTISAWWSCGNTLPTIYVSDYWSILCSCCFSGLTLGYHAIKTYITIYNREQTLYYFLLSCSFRMIPQTYLSRLCCLSDIFILSFTDVVCAQVFLSFGVFFLFVCWHNTHMDTAQYMSANNVHFMSVLLWIY